MPCVDTSSRINYLHERGVLRFWGFLRMGGTFFLSGFLGKGIGSSRSSTFRGPSATECGSPYFREHRQARQTVGGPSLAWGAQLAVVDHYR